MKKLIIAPVVIILTMTTMQTLAKAREDVVKNETKNSLNSDKSIGKEKRKERKVLKEPRENEVSIRSEINFISDFGHISNVQWKRNAQFDEATFTKDGQQMTAYYDIYSNLVGTTENKFFTDIPTRAQKEIMEKYKEYSIGDVVFFDDNEANETDMVYDDLRFEDADNYFVTLTKDNKQIVLMVNTAGDVSYFKTLK